MKSTKSRAIVAIWPNNAAGSLDGSWSVANITPDGATLYFNGTLDPAHGPDTYAITVQLLRPGKKARRSA